MVEAKDAHSKGERVSEIFARNFNRCALQSMLAFKKFYKRKRLHKLLKYPGIVDPAIPRFSRRRRALGAGNKASGKTRRAKFMSRNCGIFFDKPEFLKFENIPYRLRAQVQFEKKNAPALFNAQAQSRKAVEQAEQLDRQNEAHIQSGTDLQRPGGQDVLGNKGLLSDSRSLFESSKQNSSHAFLLQPQVLMRSRQETASVGEPLSKRFLSVRLSSTETHKKSGESVMDSSSQTDDMLRMHQIIHMLNTKDISDAAFRETVVRVARKLVKKKPQRTL